MTELILCGDNIQTKHNHIDLQMHKASNYIVGLQQLWAQTFDPKLVLVQTVASNRYEWILNSNPRTWSYDDLIASPYTIFNLKCTNPNINLHENYNPVIEFGDLDSIKESNEPNYKKKLMIEYLSKILDYEIKQHFDMGQIIRRYRQNPTNTVLVLNQETMQLNSILPRQNWTTLDQVDAHIAEYNLL